MEFINLEPQIQEYNSLSLFSLHGKVEVLNPTTSLFSNIRWHPKTQILPPPPWITATASLCLSIVAQSSPSYSMSANFFEVIKTCFLLSLISVYCSLSIRFNCSWNFVSLWLWVALDLSFYVFVFMEFCWLVAVGCSGYKFFFFWRFSRFLLLPLLSNLWQRRIMKFLLLDFLFPFFCMQFLLDFWFLGILLFGFNSGFVLVDI